MNKALAAFLLLAATSIRMAPLTPPPEKGSVVTASDAIWDDRVLLSTDGVWGYNAVWGDPVEAGVGGVVIRGE